jgi:hypothetical protein
VRWLGARIEVVAAEVGVSKYAILRAADRPSPDGRTWRERALVLAEEKGFIRLTWARDGSEERTLYPPCKVVGITSLRPW